MGVKNGVTSYIHANVTINFPDGHVCCDLCPLLETYARKQCRRTGEYLLDTRGIGYECPLQFEEETSSEDRFKSPQIEGNCG